MPVISAFFGIIVRLYHGDHNPPHVHVQYGEFDAIVEIRNGRVMQGTLPPRVRKMLKEWLLLRRREIQDAWSEAQAMRMPKRVKPLE